MSEFTSKIRRPASPPPRGPAGREAGPSASPSGATAAEAPDQAADASAPNEAGSADASSASEAPGQPPEPGDALVAELQAKLAERDARLEATLSQYKEALDEFARVKARLTRDVVKEVEAGKRQFVIGLLDVLDNLERALEAAEGDPQQAAGSLCQGVTMVRDQFHAKLGSLGVKKLVALGKPFDPLHFEAVSTVPVAEAAKDGTVIGVMRDAYLLDEQTLRHGIVAVGKHE